MYTSFELLWRSRYQKILSSPQKGSEAFEAARQVGITTPIDSSEAFSVYADYLLAAKPPLAKEELLNHALTALARNLSLRWVLMHEYREALLTQYLAQNA